MHTFAIWVSAAIIAPHAFVALIAAGRGYSHVTTKVPTYTALLIDALLFYALFGR